MKLITNIVVRGDDVTIAWSIENTLAEPVLLFHLLPMGQRIDPMRVYHIVEGWRPGLLPTSDAPRLVIAKAVMPIRPGVSVYVPDVPLATTLEPGQCFEEVLEQHFPQRQHNPHCPFGAQEGLRQVLCRRIAFRVGYAPFSSVEALGIRPKISVIDDREVYHLPLETALAAQQVMDSRIMPAEVLLWLS